MLQDSSDDDDNICDHPSPVASIHTNDDSFIGNSDNWTCENISIGKHNLDARYDSLDKRTIRSQTDEVKEHDAEKRKELQIYAFVARCIAYPFSAKYRYDMNYRPPKLTLAQLLLARERFISFIQGDLKVPFDDAFLSVMTNFYEVVLKTDEITDIITGPGWTMIDFSEVFKKNVQKRLALLPEIKGISKNVLLNNWMEKFELIFRGESDQKKLPLTPSSIFKTVDTKMTKEQLFDLFQKILRIKKHQHQILFNILQLDNSDEQAAQVRRELDYRMHEVHELGKNKCVGKCLTTEMDDYFAEELRLSIDNLKGSLQSVPVSKDDDESKEFLACHGETDRDHQMLSKHDLLLTFHVQIVIKDLKGLTSVDNDKVIFCLFETNGCDKLSTSRTQASTISWDVQADFMTNSPLPHVKVKLCQENTSLLSFDDKELARVNLILKMSSCTKPTAEWYKMQPSKNFRDKNLEIKLVSLLEKPKNVKNFGYLYCQGKQLWKKWKKRYFLLVQISQFTFLICSYQENRPESSGFLLLNDFTLDYCDPVPGLEGGHSYFTLTKEGDELFFATEDDETLLSWMQTLYRATGQILKPNLPSTTQKSSLLVRSESERICRKLFEEIAQARPNMFDHQDFFLTLQRMTLEFRIRDNFICTYGWLSSDQVFVLDEYCARYGVRVFVRHLGYLEVLMDHAYDKIFIDPSLLYQKFSFCVAHIHGNKPDRTYTVLREEKDRFMEVAYKLFKYLEHAVTNFRKSFPFGRPENGLKICLSLLERVLREINYFEDKRQSMDGIYFAKKIIEPVPESQMHDVVKKCLDQSIYSAYDHITKNCNLEGSLNSSNVNKVRETFMLVAENCIQMSHQITEYHADSFCAYGDLINKSVALFWNMFLMDLRNFLCSQPLTFDLWNFFCLFQLVNECCLTDASLNNGDFHKDLCSTFAPIILHYLENMEISIEQSLHSFFKEYIWKATDKNCCPVVMNLTCKLECLGNFVQDLNWPDDIFLEHLKSILSSINYRTVSILTSKISENFEHLLRSCKKPGDCYLTEELFSNFNSMAKLLDMFPPDSNVEKHLIDVSDKMIFHFIEKLLIELEGVLSYLSHHDANKYFLSLFSFKKPEQLAKSYTEFIQFGLLQVERNIVGKTFFQKIIKTFFSLQVQKLNDWLAERVDLKLSPFQLQTLSVVWNKISSLFSHYHLESDVINSRESKTVAIRIEMENII